MTNVRAALTTEATRNIERDWVSARRPVIPLGWRADNRVLDLRTANSGQMFAGRSAISLLRAYGARKVTANYQWKSGVLCAQQDHEPSLHSWRRLAQGLRYPQ
jgi:hypothetical protein